MSMCDYNDEEDAATQARNWLQALDNFGRPPAKKQLNANAKANVARSEPTSPHHRRLSNGTSGTGTLALAQSCSLPQSPLHNGNGQQQPQSTTCGNGSSPVVKRSSATSNTHVITYQEALSSLPAIDSDSYDDDEGVQEGEVEAAVDVAERIRHFQHNTSHPYNCHNVQASKLLSSTATSPGAAAAMLTAFAGGDSPNSSSSAAANEKLRISKQETEQITAQVRRANRPLNQWASEQQQAATTATEGGGSSADTSTTHCNEQTEPKPLHDNNSSSAYSSYSSVGTSSSQSTHTVKAVGQPTNAATDGQASDDGMGSSSCGAGASCSVVRAVPNIIDNKTVTASKSFSGRVDVSPVNHHHHDHHQHQYQSDDNQSCSGGSSARQPKQRVTGNEIDELAREVAYATNENFVGHVQPASGNRQRPTTGSQSWKSRRQDSLPTEESANHNVSDEQTAHNSGTPVHRGDRSQQQPSTSAAQINRLRVNGRPSAAPSSGGGGGGGGGTGSGFVGSSSLTTPNRMDADETGAEFEAMLRQSIQSARRHSPATTNCGGGGGGSGHLTTGGGGCGQPIGMIGRDMIVDRIPAPDHHAYIPNTRAQQHCQSNGPPPPPPLQQSDQKQSSSAGGPQHQQRMAQLNQQKSLDNDVQPSNNKSGSSGYIAGGTRGGTRPPWRRSATAPSSQDPPLPHNTTHGVGPGPSSYESHSSQSHRQSSMSMDAQQRRYDVITDRLADRLDRTRMAFGNCEKCCQTIYDLREATEALGKLYHSSCFTCHVCGRSLRGKRFYDVGAKTYCEEDYLYSGFQQTAETCASCGHLIMDMVLQAVGRTYHPQCFRCATCQQCLDGIPFALDHDGQVYCVTDYHAKFAPKCAACSQPIMPISDSDETVRVVAMHRDYHVDCYVCEGCGIQLTDEPNKRCYPLGQHLLCHACHVLWSRTGGGTQPITDV